MKISLIAPSPILRTLHEIYKKKLKTLDVSFVVYRCC